MAIQVSDIEFFLSGGPNNSNPNLSVGGRPSSIILLGTKNNLFADIANEQATNGRTDHRCFYVKNTSASEILYNSEIHLEDQASGGSFVELGIKRSTELQKVVVSGAVTSGTLTLIYDSEELVVPWGASAGSFEASLQSLLGSVAPGVVVSTNLQGSIYTFSVSFAGDSDNRSHPILRVSNNSLVGPSTPVVSVSRAMEGSPINSVAPILSVETVPPSGVNFQETGSESRISLGTLHPGDSAPVWVRRTTSPGTEYLENDGFTFRISGRPF